MKDVKWKWTEEYPRYMKVRVITERSDKNAEDADDIFLFCIGHCVQFIVRNIN